MKGKSYVDSEGNSAEEDLSDLDDQFSLTSDKKCKPQINFGVNFEEKVEKIADEEEKI